MHSRRHRRAVALLAALLPWAAAAAQGSIPLTWKPPTENTDGTPLTDLAGYRVYWGAAPGNYTNFVALANPGLTSYTIEPLAPATWFFSVTAYNAASAESAFSNVVTKVIDGPPAPAPLPGVVRNIVVTVLPPPNVGVIVSGTDSPSGEFDVAITGSGAVLMVLAGGGLFDWCDPDGLGGLGGSNQTPTTPALGSTNNDGVRFNSVTFTAPVARARCDGDHATSTSYTFSGATVTVQGVAKPLVQSGGSWSVRF